MKKAITLLLFFMIGNAFSMKPDAHLDAVIDSSIEKETDNWLKTLAAIRMKNLLAGAVFKQPDIPFTITQPGKDTLKNEAISRMLIDEATYGAKASVATKKGSEASSITLKK